ncbi:dihydrofolate reductase family protein [Isoptericola sp. NEAU-Y5]|uniref:Dihydrofolate reductase family protein n=1 Tax=Isoptericola luteus TaxID=2879484 RepID=A0ABS7ZI22_9MICO|nr:dihydrofolate reductase family protein [Isoptericola sp. NEAU-Y5]MCA5893946.1 dihydrofolate reductase family protein [Isoptericola sp. NEAU-Y5]
MTSATDSAPVPSETPLDLVVPAGGRLPADPAEERLAALYAPQAPRHVWANMISTVDGAAWGPDHLSGSINDAADWRVFRVLRALADVVLVGAGTARAEGYTALRRTPGIATGEAAPDAPLELALVTRTGQVPVALAAAERPPYVITGDLGAPAAAAVLPADRVIVAAPAPPSGTAAAGAADPGAVDLRAGLDALAARGLGHVLCEGGPHLLDAMLRAELVDDLCVTTSPHLAGAGAGRIVAPGMPGEDAPSGPALRPARLGHLLHAPGPGTMLARWALR